MTSARVNALDSNHILIFILIKFLLILQIDLVLLINILLVVGF